MISISTFLFDGSKYVPVEEGIPGGDQDYIEGYINLTINGTNLMDQGYVDYVDQLWCYLFDMINQVDESGECEFYFPDQPIKVGCLVVNTRPERLVKMTVRDKSVVVPWSDLRGSLIANGKTALSYIGQLYQGNVEAYLAATGKVE